jgi:hypothetical protein
MDELGSVLFCTNQKCLLSKKRNILIKNSVSLWNTLSELTKESRPEMIIPEEEPKGGWVEDE